MHLTGGYAVKLTLKQNSSSPISKSSLESVIFINPFSGKRKRKYWYYITKAELLNEGILTSVCFLFWLSQAKKSTILHHKRHLVNQNKIMLQNSVEMMPLCSAAENDLSLLKLHIRSDQSPSKMVQHFSPSALQSHRANAIIYLVCFRCVFQVLTAASPGFPLTGNKTRWHHQHNQMLIVVVSPSLKWAEDFANESCSCSFISSSKLDLYDTRQQQHEKVFWRCAWTMSCWYLPC